MTMIQAPCVFLVRSLVARLDSTAFQTMHADAQTPARPIQRAGARRRGQPAADSISSALRGRAGGTPGGIAFAVVRRTACRVNP